jgi:hypothetical protein
MRRRIIKEQDSDVRIQITPLAKGERGIKNGRKNMRFK